MPLVATSRIAGRIRSGQLVLGEDGATFMSASWTSGRACASGRREASLAGLPEREIVEDRAVRTIVAVACADELSKRVRHRLHLNDARLKIADMRLGDEPDLAA